MRDIIYGDRCPLGSLQLHTWDAGICRNCGGIWPNGDRIRYRALQHALAGLYEDITEDRDHVAAIRAVFQQAGQLSTEGF